VAFSPNQPWLAVTKQVVPVIGGGPKEEPTKVGYSVWVVELWDLNTQKILDLPDSRNISGKIRALAFSPGGEHLAAGIQFWGKSEPRMVRVWETHGTRPHQDFKIDGTVLGKDRIGSMRSVAYSRDGRWLAAAADGQDGAVARCVVWKADSGAQHWCSAPVALASVAFAGAARVFAATEPGGVRCYSFPPFEPLGPAIPTGTDPDTIALSPDGALVALKLPGRIQLHDTHTGAERQTYLAPGSAWTMAFTPDGKNFVSGHTDKAVRVWVVPSEK
jgi:WD40 repeat protein